MELEHLLVSLFVQSICKSRKQLDENGLHLTENINRVIKHTRSQ